MDNPDLSLPTPAPAVSAPATAPGGYPSHAAPLLGGAGENPFGEQPRRARQAQGVRKRIGSGIAAVGALLAKFGAAIKALLVALPNLKLFATAGTAFVSVAAYSLFFGWWFAVGFVALLFVHEMGHVIALRREGIKASAPMFVPFMGAAIFSRSLGENALAEARVGLAGPILGSVGAAVVAVIGELTGSSLLIALAYFGFFLNLFNLLPVVPLDGGRAAAAMSPWMWFAGFGVLVALAFLDPGNPILLIIVLFAGFELWRRWQQRKTRTLEQAAYYRVAPRHRLMVFAVYVGLIALLVFGMHETHVLQSGGHYFGRI
ncbi:MAG TPA: site-2 protease family protein [Solirubrobacteraceae bacterium]|jgi:Zn-dependent protease|nr:site-2 protease family protein [Solirubrobacteraceae bacterium]